jgi:hypothetical protein
MSLPPDESPILTINEVMALSMEEMYDVLLKVPVVQHWPGVLCRMVAEYLRNTHLIVIAQKGIFMMNPYTPSPWQRLPSPTQHSIDGATTVYDNQLIGFESRNHLATKAVVLSADSLVWDYDRLPGLKHQRARAAVVGVTSISLTPSISSTTHVHVIGEPFDVRSNSRAGGTTHEVCCYTSSPTIDIASSSSTPSLAAAMAKAYTKEAKHKSHHEWTYAASSEVARTYASATLCGDNIWYVGGWHPDRGSLASVESYNIATKTWTTRAPLKYHRESPVAVSYKGYPMVIGGYHKSKQHYTIERWTSFELWEIMPWRLPEPMAALICAQIIDDLLIVIGDNRLGEDRVLCYSRNLSTSLSTKDDTWQLLPSPMVPSSLMTSVTWQ